MKKIEAIIRPFKLDEVREALSEQEISGLIISEVRVLAGRGGEGSVLFRGAPLALDFVPRTRLELFVEDEQAEAVAAAIERAARTGREGDGEIAISSLEGLIRIGGERGTP